MRIYLAGPEVFHREARLLGARKKSLCTTYGFTGLYPLDHELPPDIVGASQVIYDNCLSMIRASDCGIFNLTPFRGPSADVGTVLELGLLVALGKPIFAYTNVADDLIDRLRQDPHSAPGLTRGADEVWRDPLGMMAEDFGNADNLMLDEALVAQGRKIHRRTVPEARRFEDLDGFVACLEEARRHYGAPIN